MSDPIPAAARRPGARRALLVAAGMAAAAGSAALGFRLGRFDGVLLFAGSALALGLVLAIAVRGPRRQAFGYALVGFLLAAILAPIAVVAAFAWSCRPDEDLDGARWREPGFAETLADYDAPPGGRHNRWDEVSGVLLFPNGDHVQYSLDGQDGVLEYGSDDDMRTEPRAAERIGATFADAGLPPPSLEGADYMRSHGDC